jgi:lipopolysaccharide/colanic/teichoic acid biosynthesis glycosyltransferase
VVVEAVLVVVVVVVVVVVAVAAAPAPVVARQRRVAAATAGFGIIVGVVKSRSVFRVCENPRVRSSEPKTTPFTPTDLFD